MTPRWLLAGSMLLALSCAREDHPKRPIPPFVAVVGAECVEGDAKYGMDGNTVRTWLRCVDGRLRDCLKEGGCGDLPAWVLGVKK
jgi:hypothetical protein